MDIIRLRIRLQRNQKKYTEAFKKQVVREYERGLMNKDQLKAKYGLGGSCTVLKWCREYGKFDYTSKALNGRPMKDQQKQRIKELESKLKAAEVKIKVYDKLFEITSRELGTDVIKKIEAKLSKSWQNKKI